MAWLFAAGMYQVEAVYMSGITWLRDGVSARSPWGIPEPVRHLLVDAGQNEWRLWCSGGAGRAEENPQSGRFCRRCRPLAADAVADGVLDPAGLGNWPAFASS